MFTHEQLTTPQAMVTVTLIMTGLWTALLEVSRKKVYTAMDKRDWWIRATKPTTQMMQNFGYPKTPTELFPYGVTEPMARDFFAVVSTICFAHFVSAFLMLPVLFYGWDSAPEATRCLFVLGTLSDVGFDIYDSTKSTMRAFLPKMTGTMPVPKPVWFVLVILHHSLAMAMVIPMNLKFIHL